MSVRAILDKLVRPTPDRREGHAVRRTVRVGNPQGLHMRICWAVAKAAGEHPAKVTVQKGDRVAEATSILDLMSLGAVHGEQVELAATGSGSHEVIELLAEFLANSSE